MADILVDACCLINLLSSGRSGEVLGLGGHRCHVCDAVAEESLFVDVLDVDQTRRTQVDLEPMFRAGAIHRCSPDSTKEIEASVHYAAVLDDGEAMCLALAKCRSWVVATDDRKGRRIAASEGISLLNTIELVKEWSERNQIPNDQIKDMVKRISMLGCYRPTQAVPEAKWWRAMGGPLAM